MPRKNLKKAQVANRRIPVKGAAGANHHKHEHPHKVCLPNRPYVLEQSEETLVIIQDTSEAWGYACLFPIVAPCAFCCMPQVRRRCRRRDACEPRHPPQPPPAARRLGRRRDLSRARRRSASTPRSSPPPSPSISSSALLN